MNVITERVKKGRKYEQVLDGARRVFLSDGFEGASVDDIAKTAGVSKATLYSYFPDKRFLFTEVAKHECRRQTEAAIATIDMAGPPRDVLTKAATHLLRFLLSDFGQRMYRIAIAESDRFPELGCEFYQSGPANVRGTLVKYLQDAIGRGELAVDDVDLAADQFAELCKATLFPRMILGVQTSYTPADLARVIDGAVETFLARYGA